MHVLWSTELLDFKRPSAVAVNSTWFIIQQLFGVDLVVLVDMDPGGSSCRKSAAVGLDPPPVPRSPLGPAASGNRLTRWARGEPLSFVGMMIHRKVKRAAQEPIIESRIRELLSQSEHASQIGVGVCEEERVADSPGAKQRAHQPHPTDLPLSRPYPGATLAGPSLKAAQPSLEKTHKAGLIAGFIVVPAPLPTDPPFPKKQGDPARQTPRRRPPLSPHRLLSPALAVIPPTTRQDIFLLSSTQLPSLEQGPRCIHPDRDSCKSRWSNVTQSSKTHRTFVGALIDPARRASFFSSLFLSSVLSESLLHPDLAPAAFSRSDRSDRCPSQLHIGGVGLF
ncbi:hypothetical protein CISG_10149 [Coccidioides immitis RMSCC 3703]|uniref:Uncharacterized protein n=1 Tax=Coccidioides immitis RMSCC 3703 TaxID=454286 RepID=A0A0J8QML3_COCIT|nr:hypothetical protein CISG_10149 [Coccidioides immitis RMSCC 3703]